MRVDDIYPHHHCHLFYPFHTPSISIQLFNSFSTCRDFLFRIVEIQRGSSLSEMADTTYSCSLAVSICGFRFTGWVVGFIPLFPCPYLFTHRLTERDR